MNGNIKEFNHHKDQSMDDDDNEQTIQYKEKSRLEIFSIKRRK